MSPDDDWQYDGRTGDPVSPEEIAESERRVREAERLGPAERSTWKATP